MTTNNIAGLGPLSMPMECPARPAIPVRYQTVKLAGGRIVTPDVVVTLEVAPKPWGRPGAPTKWNGTFDGVEIVSRSEDPEHDACRVLLARGIVGTVLFVHVGGKPGMAMSIATGAGLSTTENDRGIFTRKYQPYSRDVTPAAVHRSDDAEVAGGTLAVADDDLAEVLS